VQNFKPKKKKNKGCPTLIKFLNQKKSGEKKDLRKTGHNQQVSICHTMALPFTFKKYIKAKEEELWKLKYFTSQKYDLQKVL